MVSNSLLPSKFHAERSHWQASLRNVISMLPAPAIQERGWEWECRRVPTDNTWHIFENPIKIERFVSLFLLPDWSWSLPMSPVSLCKLKHQLLRQATVVCVMELSSSPGPGPYGYQVSPNLCSPLSLYTLVHVCSYRCAGTYTQTHISDSRSSSAKYWPPKPWAASQWRSPKHS